MTFVRRLTLTLVVVALLVAAAYGVGQRLQADDRAASASPLSSAPQDPTDPTSDPSSPAAPSPTKPPAPVAESPEPSDAPSQEPTEDSAEPAGPQAGPALLTSGDEGDEVRSLQARLRQIDWFQKDVTGFYGPVTTKAVRGFQAKREIAVTGDVDQETLDRLFAMTTEPSDAELANQLGSNVPGALDARCKTGHVVCIDKTSSTLRWVVDGRVLRTVDVRFGAEYTPTREGTFSVQYKSRDHVSSLYGSAMPFAMFFSGGQAVHYSSDFAASGYTGASHGCVNVRDYDGVAWLFDHVDVGDPVIVYRS